MDLGIPNWEKDTGNDTSPVDTSGRRQPGTPEGKDGIYLDRRGPRLSTVWRLLGGLTIRRNRTDCRPPRTRTGQRSRVVYLGIFRSVGRTVAYSRRGKMVATFGSDVPGREERSEKKNNSEKGKRQIQEGALVVEERSV